MCKVICHLIKASRGRFEQSYLDANATLTRYWKYRSLLPYILEKLLKWNENAKALPTIPNRTTVFVRCLLSFAKVPDLSLTSPEA